MRYEISDELRLPAEHARLRHLSATPEPRKTILRSADGSVWAGWVRPGLVGSWLVSVVGRGCRGVSPSKAD